MYAKKLFVCALAISAVFAAIAAPITINNPSFETPNVGGWYGIFDAAACGWTNTGGTTEIIDGNMEWAKLTPADGVQVADLIAGTALAQITDHTIAGGETYTLNYSLGKRFIVGYGGADVTAVLRSGTTGAILGSRFVSFDVIPFNSEGAYAAMANFSFTTAAAAAGIGEKLVVTFEGSRESQTSVDGVSLSFTTPEPGTIAMNNPSFETPNVGGAYGNFDAAACGWANTGGTTEIINGNFYVGLIPADGAQVADLISGTALAQTTYHTIAAGEKYTLSYSLGKRWMTFGWGADVTAVLRSDTTGAILGSRLVSQADLPISSTMDPLLVGQPNEAIPVAMATFSFTTAAARAGIGEKLVVTFEGSGGSQTSVDGVSLRFRPERGTVVMVW